MGPASEEWVGAAFQADRGRLGETSLPVDKVVRLETETGRPGPAFNHTRGFPMEREGACAFGLSQRDGVFIVFDNNFGAFGRRIPLYPVGSHLINETAPP